MSVRRVTTATRVLRAVTRAVGPDELPEVVHLLSTLGPSATADALARLIGAGGQVLVATVRSELAGVAVLEWLHPLQRPRPQAFLTALVTSAQFRHQGVARALLEECARRVRQSGADRLHLAAAPEQDEARGFLGAAGFEPRLIVYERMV